MIPHTLRLSAGRIEDMEAPNDSTIIGIILAFVTGGGLVTLLSTFFTRKRTDGEARLANANADNLIIGSALEFVNTLKGEVLDLRKSIDMFEKKVEILETHVRVQSKMIFRLRDALSGVKPDHPLLEEKLPILEL